MATELTTNTTTELSEKYPYAIVVFGEDEEPQTLMCENVSEVYDVLTGVDYSTMSDEDALAFRHDFLTDIVSDLQRLYVDSALERGVTMSEGDLNALLQTDKVKFPLGSWESDEIPYLAVTTQFAPYTEATMPVGDVVEFDPLNELDMLRQLSEVGAIHFFEK